jgi:hypothetical protein
VSAGHGPAECAWAVLKVAERMQNDAAALTNIVDPALRALGLELMSTPDRCDLGVTLLSGWFQPGDYGLIEQALRRPMSDPPCQYS